MKNYEASAIQYKDMWEKTVEENKWLHEQNDRLKGNRNENPTLRDQFAMAALSGILANPERFGSAIEAATYSYEMADAMMEKR